MNNNMKYRSSSKLHSIVSIIGGLAILSFAFFMAFNPSRHATCTVTNKTYSMTVDKDQQHNIIETTCGDFGFHQSGMGASGPSRIEVGHTYKFGYHGWHVLWSKPTILTWTEVH